MNCLSISPLTSAKKSDLAKQWSQFFLSAKYLLRLTRPRQKINHVYFFFFLDSFYDYLTIVVEPDFFNWTIWEINNKKKEENRVKMCQNHYSFGPTGRYGVRNDGYHESKDILDGKMTMNTRIDADFGASGSDKQTLCFFSPEIFTVKSSGQFILGWVGMIGRMKHASLRAQHNFNFNWQQDQGVDAPTSKWKRCYKLSSFVIHYINYTL